jgi:hypothetical protein
MQDYTEQHLDGLEELIKSSLKNTGEVEPAFIFHTNQGEKHYLQCNQGMMGKPENKAKLAAIVNAITALSPSVTMVLFITGGYSFDCKKAIQNEFHGYESEQAYLAVNKKYGSLQDSPYGKEIAMASVDSASCYWNMVFDLERTDDDEVTVKQVLRDEMSKDNSDVAKMGGTFMSLFCDGVVLRQLCKAVDNALPNESSENTLMMKVGLVIEGVKKMKGVELDEALIGLVEEVSEGINESDNPVVLQ